MFQIALLRLLTPFVTRLGSPSFRRFLLNFVPIQAVQKLKEMSDTMEMTCKDILREKRESRKLESGDGNGDGKDIMSILRKFSSYLSIIVLILEYTFGNHTGACVPPFG